MQPVSTSAVHVVVARVGRREMCGLAGIGADCLGAEAQHVALVREQAHAIRIRSRRVLAGLVEILERDRIGTLRPVGAHQHPGAGRDGAVGSLPGPHMGNGQQKIGVTPRLRRAIDDAGGCDEMRGRQRVGRIARQIAAGDPVDRCIEMSAGVLAEAHVVPVPGRTALVVARSLLDPERSALTELGRQHDRREVGGEGLREVDDAHGAGAERAHERREDACHWVSSRSSAFGLSVKRASHSCATSPG